MVAKAIVGKAENLIKDTKLKDNRRESDTLRLWEGYQDQALLWRSLALLQIPTSLACVVLSMILFYNRQTIINVPAKPAPGVYSVEEINDVEFQEVAINFVNLIASYQPATARRQYSKARELLAEPILTQFDKDMMGNELKAIENTKRTQLYFMDPSRSQLFRDPGGIKIEMIGDRIKYIAGKELPAVITKYTVFLSTVPRNDLNPYGIVVTNVLTENLEH
jgi:hypothetical protein